jgi:hypothetical protein
MKKTEPKPEPKSKPTQETKQKIPDALMITVKTQIANFTNIQFKPSMLVPDSRSSKVFFNPLVKYHAGPMENVGATTKETREKDVLAQFFESNKFDSAMNRVKSSMVGQQTPISSIQEASKKDYISNNIQVTLDMLFKKDALFYINKRPYTILHTSYDKNSWHIGTKPLNELMSRYNYTTTSSEYAAILQNAQKEIDDIPPSMRQGKRTNAPATSEPGIDVAADENVLGRGIQDTSDLTTTGQWIDKTELKLPLSSASLPRNSPGMQMSELVSQYLRENNPILSNHLPKSTDSAITNPIVFQFFISKVRLSAYIKRKKQDNLGKLFQKMVTNKRAIKYADTIFKQICKNIVKAMVQIDTTTSTMQTMFDSSKATHSISNVEKFVTQRVDVMKLVYDGFQHMLVMYDKQQEYYTSLMHLLFAVQTEYSKIMSMTDDEFKEDDKGRYVKDTSLGLRCVKFDIDVAQILSRKNVRNKYSHFFSLYLTHFEQLKQINQSLAKHKSDILLDNVSKPEWVHKYTTRYKSNRQLVHSRS